MYKSIPFIEKYKKRFTIDAGVNPTCIATKVGEGGKLWVVYIRTQKPDTKSLIYVYKKITTICH